MPLFKFRIYWEEDDNIYRDIIIKKGQTFLEFNDAILKAFEFKNKAASFFYESNERWHYGRAISSEVLLNKKDAPALSMLKTPVSALIEKPDQNFLFVFDPEKNWTFLISLIALEREENPKITYPFLAKSEGLAPTQTRLKGLANERLMEVEEKYDLQKEDMDEQGFGDDDQSESDDENEDENGSFDEDTDLF